MKLSEAILLGSIESEQGFGSTSALKSSKDKCAYGAALLAVGQEVDDCAIVQAVMIWPWITQACTPPVSGYENSLCRAIYGLCTLPVIWPWITQDGWRNITVQNIIWWLNDTLRWTRPQIAAWVATIEPQESLLPQDLTSTHLLEVGQQGDSTGHLLPASLANCSSE
jgi:hypothetical protein